MKRILAAAIFGGAGLAGFGSQSALFPLRHSLATASL